jgi:CPA2 family monovalent cation:H+ antiporter-2
MEGALMLASQTMLMAGVPLARVLKRIRQTREARYGSMRGYFRGLTDESEDESGGERLTSVLLEGRHAGCGKTLGELALDALGASVVGIRRPGSSRAEHSPENRLEAGDIVLLRGEPDALASAEIALRGN